MLQWILMAAMTAVASFAILAPLSRRPDAPAGTAGSIYRDQLRELERERAEGLVGDAEAEAARIELSRRLLKAEGGSGRTSEGGRGTIILAFIVAAMALPILALGTYLSLGNPSLPDEPLASRAGANGDDDVATLIARVERHLADDPQDGSGWELLGPIYMKLGRFDDAVKAYGNALRLLGPTADREALLGEAMTSASGGIVTIEARATFDKALELDPANDRAGFYRAIAIGQSGEKAAAIAAWKALIARAPDAAPWLPAATAELKRIETPASGPSAADVAEAAGKTPADRQAMIEGMVAGLAARLNADPADAEGWARLFRAYMVLGRPDDAGAALTRARKALAGKPELLAAVEAAAAQNGVGKDRATP